MSYSVCATHFCIKQTISGWSLLLDVSFLLNPLLNYDQPYTTHIQTYKPNLNVECKKTLRAKHFPNTKTKDTHTQKTQTLQSYTSANHHQ